MLAEEVATAREALGMAEANASEGAVAAARVQRLARELADAHSEIRRLSELEGASCRLYFWITHTKVRTVLQLHCRPRPRARCGTLGPARLSELEGAS